MLSLTVRFKLSQVILNISKKYYIELEKNMPIKLGNR